MGREDITFYIAVIGAITGVLSLILHIFDYRRNNPMTKIYCHTFCDIDYLNKIADIGSKVLKSPKNHVEIYGDTYLVFFLDIDNVSNMTASLVYVYATNTREEWELIKVYDYNYLTKASTLISLPLSINPRCSISSYYIFKKRKNVDLTKHNNFVIQVEFNHKFVHIPVKACHIKDINKVKHVNSIN